MLAAFVQSRRSLWSGEKLRRRAQRNPPSFEAESNQALDRAHTHCGLWRPKVEDVKRLMGGRTAVLLRDKRGAGVTLIFDGQSQVVNVKTAAGFR